MARIRPKACFASLGLILLVLILTFVLQSLNPNGSRFGSPFGLGLLPQHRRVEQSEVLPHVLEVAQAASPTRVRVMEEPSKRTNRLEAVLKELPAPNYHLHVFYYTWYGSPPFDGKYIHWNHPVLPHWDPKVASGYPKGRHDPPEDIGANFYPALGAYSSRDPSVIEAHMLQMRTATIGVLALSWYPPGTTDDNGEPTDDIVRLILDVAHKYHLKVVFHIEPYKGRDEQNMLHNVKYILEKYGDHPAFFRYRTSTGVLRPLFYVYDSYLLGPDQWARLLKESGHSSIRNTPFDSIFIALLVEEKHKADIVAAGFDGIYTYFATNGFTYGSSHRNWNSIKSFCESNNLMFIPSVGPGYMDTSIRPWNSQNTRNRINGKYYETALSAALEARTDIISITSFNEWHEGTQIEKAVPRTAGRISYQDYLPHRSDLYLELTRKWGEKWMKARETWLV